MIPPSSLVISQGWGLIDLPLRASNEGSPRPRVARAQEINRLHPLLCSASRRTTRLPIPRRVVSDYRLFPMVSCKSFFHSSRLTAGMVVIWMCPSDALSTAAFMAVLLSGNSQTATTSYSPRQ